MIVRRSDTILVLSAACAVVAGGCSFIGARGWEIQGRVDCTVPATSMAADLVLTAIGGGLAVASGYQSCSGESCIGNGLGTLAAGTVGGVALVSAVYGGYELHSCRSRREELAHPPSLAPAENAAPVPAPSTPEHARRNETAAQLTREAHESALRHECAVVVTLRDRVQQLDADYYANVFLVDPAIGACLE